MLDAFRSGDVVSPRFRRLGGEFLWVGLGEGLGAAGALVGVRLLTQVLDPALYGELTLGLTAVTLTQLVILAPLVQASLRFLAPAQDAGALRAYLRATQTLLARATAVVVAIAGVVGATLWLLGYSRWLALALAAFLYSWLSGYNSTLDAMQTAFRQRAVVAWHRVAGQWLRFVLAVAFVLAWGASSAAAMLGFAAAAVLVLCSQLVLFRRKVVQLSLPEAAQAGDIQDWTRQMREYAWPFVTWGVFTWAHMAADAWALQVFGSGSNVGLYAVLVQLGYYPITLLSGIMVQWISPVLFRRAGDGADQARVAHARRLNRLMIVGAMLLTLLGVGLAALAHKAIFSLLVAPDYRSVSPFLPWLVLSGGLFASGQAATLSLMSGVQTRSLIAPKIGTALLGIALSFAGAYWFGIRGVVIAGVAFSATYFVWVLYLTSAPWSRLTAHAAPPR